MDFTSYGKQQYPQVGHAVFTVPLNEPEMGLASSREHNMCKNIFNSMYVHDVVLFQCVIYHFKGH